eukprot:gene11326-8052_t
MRVHQNVLDPRQPRAFFVGPDAPPPPAEPKSRSRRPTDACKATEDRQSRGLPPRRK